MGVKWWQYPAPLTPTLALPRQGGGYLVDYLVPSVAKGSFWYISTRIQDGS